MFLYRLDYRREGRGIKTGIELGRYLHDNGFRGCLLALGQSGCTHIVNGELSVDMISYANKLGFNVAPLLF